MKKTISAFIIGSFLVLQSTQAQLVNDPGLQVNSEAIAECDQIYSLRGESLFKAQECYQKIYSMKNIKDELFFERAFTVLSTVVVDFEKKPEERIAIDKALIILDLVKKNLGEKAYYNYWKAVWTSFDATQKDRGSLIPTNIFAQIGNIQNLLKSAINEDPKIHFYGPHRVMGILHTQMPKIAGGDKKYAELMLKVSYTNQPNYFSNPYAYANILYINGKNAEAKAILNTFLATANEKYESFPGDSLKSLLPEIKKEKIKAQNLLNTINEEE